MRSKKVYSVNGVYFSSHFKALAEISRLTGKPVPTKKEYEAELNDSCCLIAQNDVFVTKFRGYEIWTYKLH